MFSEAKENRSVKASIFLLLKSMEIVVVKKVSFNVVFSYLFFVFYFGYKE